MKISGRSKDGWIALALALALAGMFAGIAFLASGNETGQLPPHRQFAGQYAVTKSNRISAEALEQWLETGYRAGYEICRTNEDFIIMCRTDGTPQPHESRISPARQQEKNPVP